MPWARLRIGGLGDFGFGLRRNRGIQLGDRAQPLQRIAEKRGIPAHHHGQVGRSDVLLRGAQHVGAGHRLQCLLVGLQEVFRIAVVFVAEHGCEDLGPGVGGSDRGSQRCLAGHPEFVFADLRAAQALDFFFTILMVSMVEMLRVLPRDFKEPGMVRSAPPTYA